MPDVMPTNRLVSLDVFRGITIAGMILVNNPGTWSAIYSPFKHAEWHGITPTDFIFPFFLFIVGVAISLSLGKIVESDGANKQIYKKIIRRTLIIFLLGLFIAAFPFFDFSTLRIPGVLQRIAVCYLITSLIFLWTGWRWQLGIGIGLLFFYWYLMTGIAVPGCEVATIDDKVCNLSAFIDRVVLGENHIWSQSKVFDPEGILSTVPAIATTISGVLTGTWLRTTRPHTDKVGGIFFFGVVLCAVGWCWNFFFPFNKALWTSSYVVYTSGLALCFLGFCYWLIDIKGYKGIAKPFTIFGLNAIALYVGAELLSKSLYTIKLAGADGKETSLQGWLFESLYLPLFTPMTASLIYAISFILTWLFFMWLLYRKNIFIKV